MENPEEETENSLFRLYNERPCPNKSALEEQIKIREDLVFGIDLFLEKRGSFSDWSTRSLRLLLNRLQKI